MDLRVAAGFVTIEAAGTDVAGLSKAPADELSTPGKDDGGPDNLDKEVETADVIVDERLADVAELPATLIAVSAEPRGGGVVLTGEATTGKLPKLGGEEIKLDELTGGSPRLHP